MGTLGLRVKYRPVRIGWCVRGDNVEDVRKALQLTHTLWGGRYNPLIPISDRELATQLINAFHVDALYATAEDSEVKDFIKDFPYLPWPDFHSDIFIEGSQGNTATFLDIYHPVRQLMEKNLVADPNSKFTTVLTSWDSSDPLGDILLAFLGFYPKPEKPCLNYAEFLKENLRGQDVKIALDDPIPPIVDRQLTPNMITNYGLRNTGFNAWNEPGIYVGTAGDFVDFVNFWNLRAAGIDLIFYDPSLDQRLEKLTNDYMAVRLQHI